MRIFDKNNKELHNPDLTRGYLKEDRIFVKHHDAVERVDEQWHYETVKVYPNGGKDVRKVIDVIGVEPKEAHDEYEDIQRYIEYTEDELKEIEDNNNKPSLEDRIKAVESVMLELILGGGL